MAKSVKINFRGEDIDGEQLDFKIDSEDWNTYKMEDGSIIKVKTVVSKITRLNKYNEFGEPIYLVNSTNLIDADVPENLKQTKKNDKDKVQ